MRVVQFQVNTTLYPNSLPLIVSAWVGPDNKHFTVRFDVQDERAILSYASWVGDETVPFTYSFNLVDENLNIHITDWFDGWVVSGIKTRAHQLAAATWAQMEIKTHKLVWLFDLVKSFVTTISQTAISFFLPIAGQITNLVSTLAKEMEIILTATTEIIGTAIRVIGIPIADAIAGLAHDLIGGFMGLMSAFGQALKPVTDVLMGLAGAIVQGFISFMQPLITAAVNVVQIIGQSLVGLIDTVFGWLGFPGGYTQFLGWLVNLWSWVIESFGYGVSLLFSTFMFFSATMAKFTSVVLQITTQLVAVILAFISFLDTGFGYTVGLWDLLGMTNWLILAAVVYPIWILYLWEDEGFDAVLAHFTFILNLMYMVIHTLITIIQNFITIIDYLLELIPIAE